MEFVWCEGNELNPRTIGILGAPWLFLSSPALIEGMA